MRIIMEWHENYTGDNFLIRIYETTKGDGKSVEYHVYTYKNGQRIASRCYVRQSFDIAMTRFFKEIKQITHCKEVTFV